MRIEEQCGEEDDSQQAAEAMVQLSGVGFYAQQQQGSYNPSQIFSLPPFQNVFPLQSAHLVPSIESL